MIKPHMVRVTTVDGTEIHEGDLVRDFRGEPWTFVGVDRLPDEGRSGKVVVSNGHGHREFYDGVFKLTITDLL